MEDHERDDYRYIVSVDTSLHRMSVEAHFARPVTRIAARSRQASRYIQNAHACDGGANIGISGRRMRLPPGGVNCLRYEVDLLRAAADERRNLTLSERNIVVSPAAWFWRPSLSGAETLAVRFDVGESTRVSVPWQPLDAAANTYRVPASPESAMAPAAFGDFDYFETTIPGATLRITIMQPADDTTANESDLVHADEIVAWIRASASNVNLAYGRFPNPSPNIVVLPVGNHSSWSDSAVQFGRVIRDGGETVELLVNQYRPINEYYDSWTATHEFGHLMLPYLSRQHRWISEGFAQYYQNVLLARAGQYSEARAWQKLLEGFERGRNSGEVLSPNGAAAAGMRTALMKIYWSGAAIALLADVELRQRSGGEESLDDVLHRLQQCCLPSETRWTGPMFFAKLDSLIDEPVFMPLYRRYADTSGFPDLEALLANLGVSVVNGEPQLRSDSALAALRSAITACTSDAVDIGYGRCDKEPYDTEIQ